MIVDLNVVGHNGRIVARVVAANENVGVPVAEHRNRLLVQPLAFRPLREPAGVRLVVDLNERHVLLQPFLLQNPQEPIVMGGKSHESLRLGNAEDLGADLWIGHEPRTVLILPIGQDDVHAVLLRELHEADDSLQHIEASPAHRVDRRQVVAIAGDPRAELHLARAAVRRR